MLMLHKNNENIEATCLCEITTLKFRQINNSHRKFALHTQRQTNNNPQVQFIHKDIYTYIEQSTGTVYTQRHAKTQFTQFVYEYTQKKSYKFFFFLLITTSPNNRTFQWLQVFPNVLHVFQPQFIVDDLKVTGWVHLPLHMDNLLIREGTCMYRVKTQNTTVKEKQNKPHKV